ncbi:30S ribosomal protein S4, partial [Candidatus Micrarchaeota archaeon]|nr:30S ribosomal protein S4 [Candidatus Micrarchaeota archaeon]
TLIRQIRREARRILSKRGTNLVVGEKQLLDRVKKFLVKKDDLKLEDLLSLTVRDMLERRLQTLAIRKGFAKTPRQSRQFIVHGHLAIKTNKVSSPSYLVTFDEENEINWFKKPVVVSVEEEKPSKKSAEAAEEKKAEEKAGEKKVEEAEKAVDAEEKPAGEKPVEKKEAFAAAAQ